MPETRNILLIALAVVAFMLWTQWQQDNAVTRTVSEPAQDQAGGTARDSAAGDQTSGPGSAMQAVASGELPDAASAHAVDSAVDSQELPDPSTVVSSLPTPGATAAGNDESQQLITVRTDVLDIAIDPRGGNIVQARLLDYPVAAKTPDIKVKLMNNQASDYYVAQTGLLSAEQPSPTHLQLYSSAQSSYQLKPGEDDIQVTLRWQEAGIESVKTFTLHRHRYVIDLQQSLHNNSAVEWQGFRYAQLQRSKPEAVGGGLANTSRYSFKGASYGTEDEGFAKLKFDKFSDKPLSAQSSNAWVGLSEHYFLSAVIPPANSNERLQTTITGSPENERYLIRTQSPAQVVAAGSSQVFPLQLYIGPKVHERLAGLAPGLELTIDYGIFTIFSKPLFWALDQIHDFIGNWGWSIVILTILIKLAFFKLTEAQYRSMARMRKLQPRVEKLKERYGDDRQKMSQAMMELYRTEKVNPLGGCLPVLVQIPIFIALYWVLLESVELRQAPFFGWVQDLSSPDPWFILPIINGAAMIATQRLTPMVGMDPMQRKIMSFLPVAFSVMFAFFPAGLVLYWATNASISLAQQWVITRRIEKAD